MRLRHAQSEFVNFWASDFPSKFFGRGRHAVPRSLPATPPGKQCLLREINEGPASGLGGTDQIHSLPRSLTMLDQ
jgi:hypothetical protein